MHSIENLSLKWGGRFRGLFVHSLLGEVPMGLAAKLILEAVQTFASLASQHVRRVEVIFFDNPARERWQAILSAFQ